MFAESRKTRAEAWLAAAQAMQKVHARLYNVVLEVEKPGFATPVSRAVEAEVDTFLKKYGAQPTHTVAETIFPAVEYRHGGISLPENHLSIYSDRATKPLGNICASPNRTQMHRWDYGFTTKTGDRKTK